MTDLILPILVGIGIGIPLGIGIFALGVRLFVPPLPPFHWRSGAGHRPSCGPVPADISPPSAGTAVRHVRIETASRDTGQEVLRCRICGRFVDRLLEPVYFVEDGMCDCDICDGKDEPE